MMRLLKNQKNFIFYAKNDVGVKTPVGDLEEAAREAATWHSHVAGEIFFPNDYQKFIAGAKWQEEHLIGKMEQFLYEELSNGDIECRDMKFLIEYLKLYMKEKLYERIR